MIYLVLFWEFFKIGLFTFGGGYAMIPMIEDAVVSHNWLSVTDFMDFIGISESTPGPFAINCATFVGNDVGGLFGGVCATVGVVLPSFIIILIIAKLFTHFEKTFVMQGILTGVRPCVVALISVAALNVTMNSLFLTTDFSKITNGIFSVIDYKAVIIAAVLFAVTKFKKIHPAFIILISAVLGIVLYGFI